jgi:hypothetical protein
MIQTGDPTGTGRGGTSIYGQKLFVFYHRVIEYMPYIGESARMKYTLICGSLGQGFSRWRIQGPTQTASVSETTKSSPIDSQVRRLPILRYPITYTVSGQ